MAIMHRSHYVLQQNFRFDQLISEVNSMQDRHIPSEDIYQYFTPAEVYIQYTVHREPCTQYTVHREPCTQYTVHREPCTQYTVHGEPCTQYTVHGEPCTQYTVHGEPCIHRPMYFTLYTASPAHDNHAVQCYTIIYCMYNII